MTRFAHAEREALADLLLAVGPDAPTLCEGWTTRDLAAHLVLRERRPDAALGIVVPPVAGWTRFVQGRLARDPWPQLVERVRQPPWWNPWSLEVVHERANLVEMAIHHEDVRRAQSRWAPRRLPAAEQRALWAAARTAGRAFYRNAPVGVQLRDPEGRTARVHDGDPAVTVTGEPLELLLHATGRGSHARVKLTGPPDAVTALERTTLRL